MLDLIYLISSGEVDIVTDYCDSNRLCFTYEMFIHASDVESICCCYPWALSVSWSGVHKYKYSLPPYIIYNRMLTAGFRTSVSGNNFHAWSQDGIISNAESYASDDRYYI